MKNKPLFFYILIILINFCCTAHFQKKRHYHKYLITDTACLSKCSSIKNGVNCGKVFVGCCYKCMKTFFTELCMSERLDLDC